MYIVKYAIAGANCIFMILVGAGGGGLKLNYKKV